MRKRNPPPDNRPSRIPTRRERFVGSIRRHDRRAIVIGALIVFATFVVREAIREHFKDLADSTDRARTAFVAHEDARAMQQQISLLGQRLTEKWLSDGSGPGLTAQRARDICEDTVHNILRPTMNNVYEHRTELWRLVEFARDLPSREQYEPRLMALDASLVAAIGHADAILGGWYSDTVRLDRFSRDELVTTMLNLGVASAAFSSEANKITDALDSLGRQLIEEAQAIRDTAEIRYNWATRASYALYIFGWTIGLAGRLLGVPDVDDR